MTAQDPKPSLPEFPITGIFGGSFDPVHNGHLGIASRLIDDGVLDKVIFMPTAQAPHKPQSAQASATDRLAMLKLAIQGDQRLEVSDYEIQRGGVSYTIDTALHFKERYGDGLRLIIGMDSLIDLHKWYRSSDLVQSCGIITYPRPGVEGVPKSSLAERFAPHAARQLMEGIVSAATFNVSSTRIRELLKSENFPEGLMPQDIYCYIKENGLYC
jgi:nicotinate-nucleotide adenylyltransferase